MLVVISTEVGVMRGVSVKMSVLVVSPGTPAVGRSGGDVNSVGAPSSVDGKMGVPIGVAIAVSLEADVVVDSAAVVVVAAGVSIGTPAVEGSGRAVNSVGILSSVDGITAVSVGVPSAVSLELSVVADSVVVAVAGDVSPGIPAVEGSGSDVNSVGGVTGVSVEIDVPGVAVAASETGQTVVETAIVLVTTSIDSAGQSVTVGAQLVIVCSVVVKMVLVVISTEVGVTRGVSVRTSEPGVSPAVVVVASSGVSPGTPAAVESDTGVGVCSGGVGPSVVRVAASETGQTVVEMATVLVTTEMDSAGQSVTVGAQLVIVCSVVVKIVLVVISTEVGVGVAISVGVPLTSDDSGGEGAGVAVSFGVPTTSLGTSAVDGSGGDAVEPSGTSGTGGEGDSAEVVPASETGHTVVETAMIEVTTAVDSAGHSATVGAQEVIVTMVVLKMVEVVIGTVVSAVVVTSVEKGVWVASMLVSSVGRVVVSAPGVASVVVVS